MFCPSRQHAKPMFQPGRLKVNVSSGVWRFEQCILSFHLCKFRLVRNYSTHRRNFMNVVKFSAHEDDVQNPCSNLAGSRSMTPVMFEDLNHVLRVRFISFEPWNEYHETLLKCSTHQNDIWTMYFLSGSYLLNPWNEFDQILVKGSFHPYVLTWPTLGQGH
jgi:hypothetical protein